MNRVAFKNPAGYGQHPAPKIHGRSGQPQLVPAGLNYIESIMAFTPKNEYFLLRERYEGRYKKRWGNKPLISGWIMVMSRDIISKNSLTKRQFSFKPWRIFFWGYGYIQIGEILAHCTPSGECFRAEDRLVPLPNSKALGGMADLGGSSPGKQPRARRSTNVPLKKRRFHLETVGNTSSNHGIFRGMFS